MKRHLIYILTAATAAIVGVNAQGQTKAAADSVIKYSWNDAKSFSEATGSFKAASEQDLEKRAMGDMRKMLTGMLPGLWITETGGSYLGSTSSGLTSFALSSGAYNIYSKGFSTVYCLVDDVPVPFNQLMLDPNQIESITYIDDILDKVKAGPLAGTGAISIKTKKGSYNTPLKINVDFEGGVNFTGVIPEWCTGAQYAQLNNLARYNSGMTMLYTEEAIEGFKLRNPYDFVYPSVDYRSLLVNDSYGMERFGINASAGSKNIKYNISMNGMRSGDIYVTDNDYNKINAAANVSTKINRYVEASASFAGMFIIRNTGNYNWANFYTVPECAYPLILDVVGEDSEDVALVGRTIYGVSETFPNNYYAQMKEGGFYQYKLRSGFFSAAIDVDFDWLLPGLKSKTQVQESSFLYTKIGKSNQYIAHYWTSDYGMGVRSTSHVGTTATSRSTAGSTISQSLNIAENLWYDWAKGGHKVHADGVFSITDYSQTGDDNRQRLMAAIAGARYSYQDRYTVDFAAEYAGSPRYMKGSRWGFFPSVGLAWNIGNEAFLKNIKAVDMLKLHAQFGDAPLSNNVFGTQYLYQAQYSFGSGNAYGPVQYGGDRWFGVNTHTSTPTALKRMAAEDLTWERVRQFDLGLDMDLFGCLRVGANAYMYDRLGLIKDVNTVLSDTYGLNGVTLYKNYESNRTTGWTVTAQYHKTVGDFSISTGLTMDHWDCINTLLVDDNYLYDYQKKTGFSTSSIRAFNCIGKYESQEQIDALPSYVDKSQLSIGDLIYEDANGDGVIDTNDKKIVGSTQPMFRYALNLNVAWKGFDFQFIGTGMQGLDYDLSGNDYFTTGSGDENLSRFVLEKLGTEYPSLSYVKSKNNFVSSSFWLRDRSYFKIQNVEFGYNFKFRKENAAVKGIRLALKGENLATFSKFEYCDPEAPTTGVSAYPIMRTVTLGAKIQF